MAVGGEGKPQHWLTGRCPAETATGYLTLSLGTSQQHRMLLRLRRCGLRLQQPRHGRRVGGVERH